MIKPQKKWTISDNDFLSKNLNILSIDEISKVLNRTKKSIYHKINKLKLNKIKKYKYRENIDIFKNDKILGYICGIVAADGYISKPPYQRLCLYLQKKDIKTVEFICNNIILDKYKLRKSNSCYGFSICVPSLIEYLKNIGIKNNKSFNIDVDIENKSDIFKLYFLRGIIDGDGNIYVDKKHPYNSSIHISSASKKILENIQSIFGGNIYKRKTNSCYILKWSGYDSRKLSIILPLDEFAINRKTKSILNLQQIEFAHENKPHGVSKHKNKFCARIQKDKKQIYLGIFDELDDAKRAYDKKAFELFGSKSKLNFPEEYRKE